MGAPQGSILSSLFLIYIKSYGIYTVKQLGADDILTFHCYAKTLAGELDPDLKAYIIQSRSELGSESYIFMENDKIISLTNLFQHLLSAEISCE